MDAKSPAFLQLAAADGAVAKMIIFNNQQIEPAAVLQYVRSDLCGATVLFLGTTRRITKGRETVRLEYECYEPMARKKCQELLDEASKRWAIEKACIVHRTGAVNVGETSVAVATSSPHRKDAFEAAQWLIDTLKELVPIWKQENWADGTSDWVHPDH